MNISTMISWLNPSTPDNTTNCPIIFDSWSCFNSTLPGLTQQEMCPDLPDLGFDRSRKAEKYCTDDGQWWVHPETNRYLPMSWQL